MIKEKRFEYDATSNAIIDNQDLTYTLCQYEPKWYNGKDKFQMEELCEKLNQTQLEKERAEAKLRAMEL